MIVLQITSLTKFYGDQPAYEHERRAINALIAKLQRRNIAARLLVNFYVARGARQIDLVVVTAQRCLLVELKSPDMRLPLMGTINGPWKHVLPDGRKAHRRPQLLHPGPRPSLWAQRRHARAGQQRPGASTDAAEIL